MDTHAFKRSLHHSDRYNRRGFGRAEEVAGSLEQAYQSSLIGSIRDNGYHLTHGRLQVRLAEAFGFCWGVERAVAMAYETRRHYPQERIWITNEIIHNPSVNDHLREMDVLFISVEGGVKDFSGVASGDVVILPALVPPFKRCNFSMSVAVTLLTPPVLGFQRCGRPLKSTRSKPSPRSFTAR